MPQAFITEAKSLGKMDLEQLRALYEKYIILSTNKTEINIQETIDK